MIDFLTAVFTDPLTLGVLGTFAAFMLFELARPGRRFVRMRAWRLQGALMLVFAIALTSAVPLLWDEWFAEHRLVDATGLGHVGGAFAGFGVLSLGIYVWHRLLHAVPLLWRFHQMHHSAERLDVASARSCSTRWTTSLFSFVTSAWHSSPCSDSPRRQRSPPASATTFCTMFQHANVKHAALARLRHPAAGESLRAPPARRARAQLRRHSDLGPVVRHLPQPAHVRRRGRLPGRSLASVRRAAGDPKRVRRRRRRVGRDRNGPIRRTGLSADHRRSASTGSLPSHARGAAWGSRFCRRAMVRSYSIHGPRPAALRRASSSSGFSTIGGR